MTEQLLLQENAALQASLAKAVQKFGLYIHKVSTVLFNPSRWDELNHAQQKLIQLTSTIIKTAMDNYQQAYHVLKNTPFVISKPLHVNRVNQAVYPREEGDIGIAHYKFAPGFTPSKRKSSLKVQSVILPRSSSQRLNSNPQLRDLLTLSKVLGQVYQNTQKIFFSQYEMASELSKPLTLAVASLQDVLYIMQEILGVEPKERVMPIITMRRGLTPTKRTLPAEHQYRLTPRKHGEGERRLLKTPPRTYPYAVSFRRKQGRVSQITFKRPHRGVKSRRAYYKRQGVLKHSRIFKVRGSSLRKRYKPHTKGILKALAREFNAYNKANP